jgi:hypothetical protein
VTHKQSWYRAWFGRLIGRTARGEDAHPAPSAGGSARARQELLPQLAPHSADDFVDLTFAITERKQTDGGERFTAAAREGEREVAFAFILGGQWRRVEMVPGHSTYQGTAGLQSVGARSDALVDLLDRFYGVCMGVKDMAKQVPCTGISLEGDPAAPDAGPLRLKLFFGGEDAKPYSEVFLNLDARAQTIELAEKDPDYRRPLLRVLSGT